MQEVLQPPKREVVFDHSLAAKGWRLPEDDEHGCYPPMPVFCPEDADPYDTVEWTKRVAEIKDDTGKLIFELKDAEVPAQWSQQATNIVASKYFYGLNTDKSEKSAKQLISRVADTIAEWGMSDGYFVNEDQCEAFRKDLSWLCLHQYGAFNSPVWFNVGLGQKYGVRSGSGGAAYNWKFGLKEPGHGYCWVDPYTHPQASACFILSIGDSIDDIWQSCADSARLFKYGSGVGANWSKLRSTCETLSGGGKPSGPCSFMKVQDATGGTLKSGGRTRRSAIMQILNDSHPDIVEFIDSKSKEEDKALALIRQGYPSDYNGEAYSTVAFQNTNQSVRASGAFLKAVEEDKEWSTKWVTDPTKSGPKYKAKELFMKMAARAWRCGDPGIQYDSVIQKWHTCPNSGLINASNPCSEYLFLDDTACNLASLNLLKFWEIDSTFDYQKFKDAVHTFFLAQEILVGRACYPTLKIAENSENFRPLGLGYSNLGALLMTMGLPYDSDKGRAVAGAITAIMTGHAYTVSAIMAKQVGPFNGFKFNAEPMLKVMSQHKVAADNISKRNLGKFDYLKVAAENAWSSAVTCGENNGYRNAQATVLAPCGTISFMMDCTTTGIEPELALVKYKLLAGGGTLKIVNHTVKQALTNLGYSAEKVDDILNYVEKNGTVEGCNVLAEKHLPVFECSFPVKGFTRAIHWKAHLKMMAAAQPFISGAISKTINMPKESTVEDVAEAYMEGANLELKAVAIYRDGCKSSQPLSTKQETVKAVEKRKRLPTTRTSVTHKFSVDGHEGYLIVGLHEDGSPGELFIVMAKEGSTVGGMMGALGTSISMGLQYGVPLEEYVKKFSYVKFEPSGMTSNKKIPLARSVVDYVFRWMGHEFGILQDKKAADKEPAEQKVVAAEATPVMDSSPSCSVCGSITVRAGSCYLCNNCGSTSGCG